MTMHMDEDALSRFRRSNVGIVFQSFHLVPTMTAVENVLCRWNLPVSHRHLKKPRPCWKRLGWRIVWPIIRHKCRAGTTAHGAGARACRQSAGFVCR